MACRIKSKQVLFFIAYGIFVVMTLLRTTFFFQFFEGMVFKAGLAFCVLLIALGELLQERSKVRSVIVLAAGCLFVAFAVFVNISAYLVLLATVFFIFSARDIPFRKVAAFSAVLLFVFLCFVILSSQVGIVNDYILDESGARPRHFLGFRYALYPSIVSMNITMLVVYFRKNLILWLEIVFFTAWNYLIYYLTGSRLAFILSLAALVFAVILKLWPTFLLYKKKLKYLLAMSFIIMAIVSMAASYRYDSTSAVQSKINTMLSGRLKHQKSAVDEYGFTLFGNDVEMHGNGLNKDGSASYDTETEQYFYIDNNYIQWYILNGAVFLIIIVAINTIMAIRSVKYDRKGYLILMFAMMSVFCVIQDTYLSLHYNTFLMAAGNLLMNRKDEAAIEADDGMKSGPLFRNKLHVRKGPDMRRTDKTIRWN